MRPRVFPAEDGLDALAVGALGHASMRPRVFPAEDFALFDPTTPYDSGASMRPRVFPAEDFDVFARHCRNVTASMRPRVFPAEDKGSFRTLDRAGRLQ